MSDNPKKIHYECHMHAIELPAIVPKKPDCLYDRQALEILAGGKISTVFGDLFKQQDDYYRQVRMPEPPLLLADRVMSLEGVPGSMKSGTICTETDVSPDSWYLHDGRMPAGIMVESGQADLLLASWLGIDFHNKNERIYRLLGCDLTFHGPLAKVGETLHYKIHLTRFAKLGDTYLMFFYYDCYVNGDLRMSVREGQAGFFTDQELLDSRGILWTPETCKYTENPQLAVAPKVSEKRQFDKQAIEAFAQGNLYACFGTGFEWAQSHNHSPRIQSGNKLFLDAITHFDSQGGPAGRGYMRAVQNITPDDWFFKGHFKNDPCMPGTLMAEAGMQVTSFYLAALGFTVEKDGWRFEPVPDSTSPMRCRGQCVPTSKQVVYEIFIDEIISDPYPAVFVELLVTVDGVKGFHASRFSVRLVPDTIMHLYPEYKSLAKNKTCAHDGQGFLFNEDAMLAAAWGAPYAAFGQLMSDVPSTRKIPRLPGPPYLFMSRIKSLSEAANQMRPHSTVEVEYDIPKDAWYFQENDKPVMPYAVLMEVALQPCGWLASYVGCSLQTSEDIFFRNLDGKATLREEIVPTMKTLTTKATLTSISKLGNMILVQFLAKIMYEGRILYEITTGFGNFTGDAFKNQAGIPPGKEQIDVYERESNTQVSLLQNPPFPMGIHLAKPRLLMIDKITGIWPGKETLFHGQIRAEKRVNPDEWFFKAHFFRDPVQPGSLGCQALIQLLQFYMLYHKMHTRFKNPCFQPIALDISLTWKYRGQVVPRNKQITLTMTVNEVNEQDDSTCALAEGSLWVDGKCIYKLDNIAVRIAGIRKNEFI